MYKLITIQSRTTPDQPGYGDRISVCSDVGALLFHGDASCCPNPTRPWPRTWIKWQQFAGWLACGEYHYECVEHKKFGKCLELNWAGTCCSRTPNPEHGGAAYLKGVYVHKGWSATWRGSLGCITVPPADWATFIGLFDLNETGPLVISDWSRAATGEVTSWAASTTPTSASGMSLSAQT